MTLPSTERPDVTGRDCVSAADRITKSLLGWGAVAGLFYLTLSLAQALTREGFDLGLHSWSILANGSWGWIQTANLMLTGVMVTAFAVGLGRAVTTGIGARAVPRLIGIYGATLVAAGILRADPVVGFPVGTEQATVSWHGTLHLLAGAVGFGCFAAAAVILGRRQRAAGHRRSAVLSWVTALLYLLTFAALAGTGGASPTVPAFALAVVLSWAWMASVAVQLYRTVGHPAAEIHH